MLLGRHHARAARALVTALVATPMTSCFQDSGGPDASASTTSAEPTTSAGSSESAATSELTSATTTGDAGTGTGTGTEVTTSAGPTTTGGSETSAATTDETTGAIEPGCGDGALAPGEECDEGEDNGVGCCSASCTLTSAIRSLDAGQRHTCVALCQGDVMCWGRGNAGGLGDGTENHYGDDVEETLAARERLPFFDDQLNHVHVAQVVAADRFSCALLEGGAVRCWGENGRGQLARGDSVNALAPPMANAALGGAAVKLSALNDHACALMDNGDARCWGSNDNGQLGLGNTSHVGDDELPADIAPIELGQAAIDIAAGGNHSCVVLEDGALRCWGQGGSGQLGLGSNEVVGDDEVPLAVPPLEFESPAVRVWAGYDTTCALLTSGALRCWGLNQHGELGLGHTQTVNLATGAESLVPLAGAEVHEVAMFETMTCAILGGTRRVHCWGGEPTGQLATGLLGVSCYTNMNTTFGCSNISCCIGDEMGESPLINPHPIDAAARMITVGQDHACAVSESHTLHCWGLHRDGSLARGPLPNACTNGLEAYCLRHADCCLGDGEPATEAATLLAY